MGVAGTRQVQAAGLCHTEEGVDGGRVRAFSDTSASWPSSVIIAGWGVGKRQVLGAVQEGGGLQGAGSLCGVSFCFEPAGFGRRACMTDR